jgi:hypothetical protein
MGVFDTAYEGVNFKVTANVTELEERLSRAEASITKFSQATSNIGANAANPLKAVTGGIQQVGAAVSQVAPEVSNLTTLFSGVGLLGAITAISAVLSTLIQKYGSLSNAYDQLVSGIRPLSEFQLKVADGLVNETSRVETLVALYPLLAGRRDEQKRILGELNKIAPDYFANLDTEKQTVDGLTKATDAYVKSLLGKIFIETQQERIKEIVKEQAKELVKLTDIQQRATEKRESDANAVKNQYAAEQRLADLRAKGVSDIQLAAPKIVTKKTFDEAVDDIIKNLDGQVQKVFAGFQGLVDKLDFKSALKDGVTEKAKGVVIELPFEIRPKATIETSQLDQADAEVSKRFRQQNIQVLGDIKLNPNVLEQFKAFGERAADALNLAAFRARVAEFKQLLEQGLAQPLGDIIFNFLDKGKLKFQDFADSVGKAIKRIVAQIVASKIIQLLTSLVFPGSALGALGGIAGVGGGGLNLNITGELFGRGTDIIGSLAGAVRRIGRTG